MGPEGRGFESRRTDQRLQEETEDTSPAKALQTVDKGVNRNQMSKITVNAGRAKLGITIILIALATWALIQGHYTQTIISCLVYLTILKLSEDQTAHERIAITFVVVLTILVALVARKTGLDFPDTFRLVALSLAAAGFILATGTTVSGAIMLKYGNPKQMQTQNAKAMILGGTAGALLCTISGAAAKAIDILV